MEQGLNLGHMITYDVNATMAYTDGQTEWHRCWFAHGEDELRTTDAPDNKQHVVF